ncbi:MAG: hypothetical protein FJ137_23200 [Deltaproteobacteria bacterium]|nr:hypothetical protein [Deltaproteobacteria bacterium]
MTRQGRRRRSTFAPAVATLAGAITCAMGCAAAERQQWEDTFAGDGDDAFLVDDDFACFTDRRWADVDGRRVWNVFGGARQAQAVALAVSRAPGEYPVGTVLQLFTFEAMVKRGAGFSPATNDWEYLVLDTSSGSTVITARGTTDVGNVGGTCLSCHGAATAHDSVCFTNSSCRPLPFFVDTEVVPASDERCR